MKILTRTILQMADELVRLQQENESLKQYRAIAEYRIRSQEEELTLCRTQVAELLHAKTALEARLHSTETDRILVELHAGNEAAARRAIVSEGEVLQMV